MSITKSLRNAFNFATSYVGSRWNRRAGLFDSRTVGQRSVDTAIDGLPGTVVQIIASKVIGMGADVTIDLAKVVASGVYSGVTTSAMVVQDLVVQLAVTADGWAGNPIGSRVLLLRRWKAHNYLKGMRALGADDRVLRKLQQELQRIDDLLVNYDKAAEKKAEEEAEKTGTNN